MDRFQDALLTEELDPGLFRRQGKARRKREARINQFLELLKRADRHQGPCEFDRRSSCHAIVAVLLVTNGGGRHRMILDSTVEQILSSYDEKAPLAEALTIPAPWYVDPRIAELERRTVFSNSWQVVGRADQVNEARRVCDRDRCR